jgi:hypothetical protein
MTYHEMEEHQVMLDRIREALKPGGRLVVVESITDKRRKLRARSRPRRTNLLLTF